MAIRSGVGSPQTVSAANGGKVYAFNNMSTTPQTVAPANPARVSVTFVNPHATITMYVAPSVVLNLSGVQSALTPSTGSLGGCIPVLPGAFVVLTGECQISWQAFSASSTALPFTVIDTNA